MNRLVDRIAVELGADRVLPLPTEASGGPLSWLQLREEVARRVARADRPFETPPWNSRRLIPFRDRSWHYLTHLAAKLRQQGTSVSPDELAALLLERQIETLEKTTEVEPSVVR